MSISFKACIALGSNLGDRKRTLDSAIDALNNHHEINVISASSFIETEPIGVKGQGPYLNGAAVVETKLDAIELLDALLSIEMQHGRVRSENERYGPRTLDLDLLLFDDKVMDQPGITIPHPEMHKRQFVLEPLAEIAPEFLHSSLNVTIESLLKRVVMLEEAGMSG